MGTWSVQNSVTSNQASVTHVIYLASSSGHFLTSVNFFLNDYNTIIEKYVTARFAVNHFRYNYSSAMLKGSVFILCSLAEMLFKVNEIFFAAVPLMATGKKTVFYYVASLVSIPYNTYMVLVGVRQRVASPLTQCPVPLGDPLRGRRDL